MNTSKTEEGSEMLYAAAIITIGLLVYHFYNKSKRKEEENENLKKDLKETKEHQVRLQEIITETNNQLTLAVSRNINITNNNTNMFLPINNLQQDTIVSNNSTQLVPKEKLTFFQNAWKGLEHIWEALKFFWK
jgi:archaellum component FlaF (FlaF/FlaG flagellin family)